MQFLFKHAASIQASSGSIQARLQFKYGFDSRIAPIQALGFYSRAVSIQARPKSKLSGSILARLLFLTLKNQMMNDHDVCFVSDFDFLIGLCSKILMKT